LFNLYFLKGANLQKRPNNAKFLYVFISFNLKNQAIMQLAFFRKRAYVVLIDIRSACRKNIDILIFESKTVSKNPYFCISF